MLFEVYTPLALAEAIQEIIYFHDYLPPARQERVVPTPGLFLVIELDGISRQILGNRRQSLIQEVDKGWISGLQRRFLTISAHEHSEMLAVKFSTLGAFGIINTPLSIFENQVVPATSLFGPEFLTLRQDLISSMSFQKKMACLESWLSTKYRPITGPAQELTKILVKLQSNPHQVMAEIAADYPHSHRQLIADFKKYIGTTPKFFQRIVRFGSILSSIENKQTINWSELAYHWGFSDQSHLIREFQHFSGFAPSQFLDHNFHKSGTNFFPLVKNLQD
jgi:AraC-like DNA-binding protein